MLALIAGTVSYLHMHLLVELHGQPGWVAALTPLSVDGMIVAASTTLLAEARVCACRKQVKWEWRERGQHSLDERFPARAVLRRCPVRAV